MLGRLDKAIYKFGDERRTPYAERQNTSNYYIDHLIAHHNPSKCSFKCSSNRIVNLIANLIVHLITYLVHLDHLVHLSSYPETTQSYPNSSFA